MDYIADLIALPHLHEPAILHCLCKRFEVAEIYTYVANAILLAVNPLKKLPCYTQDILRKYSERGAAAGKRGTGEKPPEPLGPHVFAIADAAYRAMVSVRFINSARNAFVKI